MTTLINLTPHAIDLMLKDGATLTIQPEDTPARVGEQSDLITHTELPGGFGPMPIYRVHETHLDDDDPAALPAQQPGVMLIVSRMVAALYPDRTDVVFPFGVVRDTKGRPAGNMSFGRVGGAL